MMAFLLASAEYLSASSIASALGGEFDYSPYQGRGRIVFDEGAFYFQSPGRAYVLVLEDTTRAGFSDRIIRLFRGIPYLPVELVEAVFPSRFLKKISSLKPVVLKAEPKSEKIEPGDYKVVVIDPGHGGKDPGALGPRGLKEKDVVLAIAKKLKKELESRGFVVYLTRDSDYYIPLEKRSEFANRKKAGIFISIHANASFKKKTKGVEVYYLSLEATDSEARAVAAMENGLIDFGEGRRQIKIEEEGYLPLILGDMAQTEYVEESIVLAERVLKSLSRTTRARARFIKGARFVVLEHAMMPAVLVETGYITNPVEAQKLADEEYQWKVARGIADGVVKFVKEMVEKR